MMEEFIPKIFEMGSVAVVAIAGYWTITKLLYKKNGNGYDKKIYDIGKQIETNHLDHILKAIEKGNEQNFQQHEKQIELLSEIKGRISS